MSLIVRAMEAVVLGHVELDDLALDLSFDLDLGHSSSPPYVSTVLSLMLTQGMSHSAHSGSAGSSFDPPGSLKLMLLRALSSPKT